MTCTQVGERWLPVVGYEGMYEVSDRGRVKSLARRDRNGRIHYGRVLSFDTAGSGYMSVVLCVDGVSKKPYVHRLVAEAFIPNPDGKEQVNHIDGDKHNNCVENLEWVTRSENGVHSYQVLGREHPKPMLGKRSHNAKLTDEQIRAIRKDRRYQRDIAAEYGVSQKTISAIKRRKNYKYVKDSVNKNEITA